VAERLVCGPRGRALRDVVGLLAVLGAGTVLSEPSEWPLALCGGKVSIVITDAVCVCVNSTGGRGRSGLYTRGWIALFVRRARVACV